ncbi:hypothetical protein [Sphingobacterium wenxiniae]|uniref:Uncharacterized protein n=1 Tax=Sphingobacterium wenxiniae TaxID=683125 RepID=A0A1I6UA62_9SPHI|nr:hypothetical protein [Sphingobacterium wenxiniae]SFS98330.1 hypothetical protein SAMN05660206_10883 [Sphingobacterium wenxiniae]
MDIQMFMDLYDLLDANPLSVEELAEVVAEKAPRKCKIAFPF